MVEVINNLPILRLLRQSEIMGCYTRPILPTGKNGMDKSISTIDDYRPHLTVNCGESVHVVPVALLEDVISGKKDFTQIEQWDVLLKTILKDWLSNVRV